MTEETYVNVVDTAKKVRAALKQVFPRCKFSVVFTALALEFDVDVAHPGRNNPFCVVLARRILTAADDGLQQPWSGLIWMNPPFGGRRGQVPWLRKFFAHGNGIALVAARTSADWFHEVVVPNAETLLFPNGKTKFVRVDGSIGKEPGTGIVLIGMGETANRALRRSGLGWFVDNHATRTVPGADERQAGIFRGELS